MCIFISEWLCGCGVHAGSNHSHLSMIAHMSRLTFSKAPTVPFSTACKSAGWSSTKIACMQPWKERWEGGNSVWRKYPESNKRRKKNFIMDSFTFLQITESSRWINTRIWEGEETKRLVFEEESERGERVWEDDDKQERWILLIRDLKCIMKSRPSVEVDIRLNSDIILDEEQQARPVPGYCHFLKPWTFISPRVLELIHKAH